MSEKKILILGLGYIGLPLFLILKSKKLNVIGYDIDSTKILLLKKKKFIFNEKPLNNLYNKLNKNKNLTFVNKFVRSDVYIICVPTPIKKNKTPNLTPLINASKVIGKYLSVNDIVIYESTVYPGCTEEECVPILEKSSGMKFNTDFFCGYSPERISPGAVSYTHLTLPTILLV